MILRPYGIVVEGELQLGLEVLINRGAVEEVRPHTGVPEDYVLSPAFVSAHSHLEYRGLLGRIPSQPFWPWVGELVHLYAQVPDDQALRWAHQAAEENRQTGVALIAEHSNRPLSGAALSSNGLGGTIYQETLTLDCWNEPADRLREVEERAERQRAGSPLEVFLSPHAPYTVGPEALRRINSLSAKISIHAAESPEEETWMVRGEGPIAEFLQSRGIESPRCRSTVAYLDSLGLLRPGTQLVHCCSVDDADIESMAKAGVTVAHCPASNAYLHCKIAPVRRMLQAGLRVGLGLDSAASGGPIDMFAAMRSALTASELLGEPIAPEEVWNMATTLGAESLGREGWDLRPGTTTPLIKIHVPGAHSILEVIEAAAPGHVEWLEASGG